METIELTCPLCNNTHSYSLAVERTTIRYFMGNYGEWYDREFTRLFTCPTQKEKFQATFILQERREDMIANVNVIKEKKPE